PEVVAVPAPAAAPTEPPREAAAPSADASFHPAEELTQLPLPQGDPELRDIAPQLVSRRLRAEVWIDATGTVRKAEVRRNELSPELAARLEEALTGVHFTPGRLHDESVGAILRTLLCFDDAGLLQASSDECWTPQPGKER
ncbi:hypothetical protein, partial [Ramlibacter alkalitolerans]